MSCCKITFSHYIQLLNLTTKKKKNIHISVPLAHTQPPPPLWPPHWPPHWVRLREGLMPERHRGKGLWETVERPMRALQTARCRASPPTYDCSPAVAVATAALDGRRSYFVKRQVCVYVCLFKSWKPNSSQLTLVLEKEEAHHVTPPNLDTYRKNTTLALNTIDFLPSVLQ